MLYDWPVKRQDRTHARLGTLGEFRGLGPNDITRLHSGTDIACRGNDIEVWSPDTGLVRRHTPAANGNPSGGGGPIRIGHFAFNHIQNIYAKPQSKFRGVILPADLPIYVVEPGTKAYLPKSGITNPSKDNHFRRGGVQKRRPVVAYRRIDTNNYQRVTFWPRSLPIGRGVQPTDLHCVYYESADGPYADGGNVANCLEVFRNYSNQKMPIAEGLRMYTQNGDQLFLDLGVPQRPKTHTPAMGGLDFKLWAHSPFNSKCGIYQIEYEIMMHLGRTTGRLNAWRFHKNPPDNVSFDLVDSQLSSFDTVFRKHTVYIITNSRNGNIDKAYHWEVENPDIWPDGCYAIKIWLKNIRKSGNPQTNERLYGAEWKVDTLKNGHRKITITRKFRKQPLNWQPSYKECDLHRGGKTRLGLKWGGCTWEEVRVAAEQGALAVAPFGSTEQHGPMLPLDTDIHIAERLAMDGARLANERYGVKALVMPTMPYGLALHHMEFAGTVSLMPETYVSVVADVLRSAVHHGFRKIAVISGHGGNLPGLQLGMTKVVAEFAHHFPLRIALFGGHRDPEFSKRSREFLKDEPSEGQPGIHAGRWETSETLADRPELVRRERLERPELKRQTVPEWKWMTHELSETGAFGDPSLARADLGEKMWSAWADAVALFLKRLADEQL